MQVTLRFAAFSALIALASSIVFPILFSGPYPHPPGPVFDRVVNKQYLHQIGQDQPVLVFLGDSLLTKDLDEAAFEQQTGISTFKLDIPGSSSAVWYLVIKSNIVPLDPAPRYLAILFRETMLTAPAFRVTGPYFGLVDKFAGQNDRVLRERAYVSQLNASQAVLESYFPLYTYRGEVRESLDAALRHGLPALVDCDSECADKAMLDGLRDTQPEIFAASLIQAEQVLYAGEQLDFGAQVDRSFLPEIIRLAQQRGIQLIFVRAPTRIHDSSDSEPEALKSYMHSLEEYLHEHNVALLDLAWTDGIESEQFADPHHMTLEGKAIFTQILADQLEAYVK